MFRLLQKTCRDVFTRNIINSPSLLNAVPRRYYTTKNISSLIETLRAEEKSESSAKHLEALVEQIENEPVDGSLALKILQCCRDTIDESQQNTFHSVWTKLNEQKCDLQITHYATAMQYYQRVKNAPQVLNLFEGLQEAGLSPTPMIYHLIINTFCRDGNQQKVIEWMARMDEAGFYLHEKSLNSVMFCSLKNGDYETASRTLNKLNQQSFVINHAGLLSISRFHARHGDFEKLKKLITFFKQNNLELRNEHILDVIHELATRGFTQRIDEMFEYFDPKDANSYFIHTTIMTFVENGQAYLLPRLLQAMGANINSYTKFLQAEMRRVQTPDVEFNRTMESLKLISVKSQPNDASSRRKNDFSYTTPRQSDSDFDHGLTPSVLQNNNKVFEENLNSSDEARFDAFLRERNIVEIESLLERGKVNMTNSKYAKLVELFTSKGHLHKALETLNAAQANDKSFKLNPIFLAKLVTLMILRGEHFREAEKLLLANRPERAVYRNRPFEQLFDCLAGLGKVALLTHLYNAVIENNIIEETLEVAVPLVTVHLTNGNLERAIDTYEKFVKTKNLTPKTFELMCECIKKGESELLQRVYEIYKEARDESLAEYRLAFAHLECGNDDIARTIFESGKIKNLAKKIAMQCRSLEKFSNADVTERLLKVTKNVACERVRIYRTLLEIYCNNKQADEAIELWRQFIQEDPVRANADFANRLIRFLRDNKQSVPSELLEIKAKQKNRK